ncbi:MAG: hypothetical protein LBI01_05665 [Elusimicrobium sp.]|jgi:hypothetical protein|nr:hypothetical protein [Elusimicrobium sp.]
MTEIKVYDKHAAKKLKTSFLKHLQNSPSIDNALEAAGLEPIKFFSYLDNDKDFEFRFHKIVNQKLEIAFLDAALKTKSPTILSFALTNRLAEKYNKAKAPFSPPETAQIIFTDASDEGNN